MVNGVLNIDDATLQTEAINYFKQLFEVDHSTTPNTLIVNDMPRLSEHKEILLQHQSLRKR
jgi:hypothetical protein